VAFYRHVHPPGVWGPIAAEAGGPRPTGFGWHTFLQMIVGLAFVLAGMFGVGLLLLGKPIYGVILLGFSAVTGGSLAWYVYRWRTSA
jgi:hypothetical protein